jgi:5-methyltetrahydrofolate--homocysteine methyltransferase
MEKPLFVIGENLNATRKIRATSPRIQTFAGNRHGLPYKALDGSDRYLDVTDALPSDPKERQGAMIPHIGQAVRNRDVEYLRAAAGAQVRAGADAIDLCVDELAPYPEERHELMRWIVRAVQHFIDAPCAIDSSDSDTILAGLEVYDRSKNRPFINSTNLEEGRLVLIEYARKFNARLIGNASGKAGMPYSAAERVENLTELMGHMDAGGIPMEDRFIDCLVFPVGAGSDYGQHFLDAVKAMRQRFGDEVHLFGGLSNVSFGLPERKSINDAFIILSIVAGCDAIMIDPLMNPPERYQEFKLAADALTGKDEFCVKYLEYFRAKAAET